VANLSHAKAVQGFQLQRADYAEAAGELAAGMEACGRPVPHEYTRDGIARTVIELELLDASQAELLQKKYDAMHNITSGTGLKCDKIARDLIQSSLRFVEYDLAAISKIRLQATEAEVRARYGDNK